MIDPSRDLFDTLEVCADTALQELRSCRAQMQVLEARLAEAEAARLELMEENRELDEQNRELEEDNARLRERLRRGEPVPAFPGPARRAQGLAALMGQRSREPTDSDGELHEPAGAGELDQTQPAATGHALSPDAAIRPQPSFLAPAAPVTRENAGQEGATMQGSLAIEQAPSADALLHQWYRRYPGTFFKGHTRPLKVGIHHDLAAREPWPEKLVRRALAGYVNLPRYLKAVREGAQRIDLDGAIAGSVDAQAAEHARRKLERLHKERRVRDRGTGTKTRRDGGTTGAAPRAGDSKPRKARRDTAAASSGHSAPVKTGTRVEKSKYSPVDSASPPADPKARMEAKLSALMAKHGGPTGRGR